MPSLWGRRFTRRELEAATGHPSQAAGITRFTYDDGPARGMRAIEIDTGSGLVVWVHPDRALDIPRATFRGIPLGWRGSPGDTAPGLTDPTGLGLMRSLPGGLLFTCGLTNVGPPSEDAHGEALPIHGHVHSLPAAEVGAWSDWEGDDRVLRVAGRVTQARLFREKLEMTRTVTAVVGEARIVVEDAVRNAGFTPAPLMLLHHINLGAPLLAEGARVTVTSSRTVEWKAATPPPAADWQLMPAPQPGAGERVFFHDAQPDAHGWAEARLENAALTPLGLTGVAVRWRTAEEPRLWQWVFPASGEYVLGLEPTNAAAPGLKDALGAGQRILEPGETARMEIEVRVLPS